jgi:hypothetical protein
MINFCTYFDKNYLSKFLTLINSLNKFNLTYTFFVVSLDDFVFDFFKKNYIPNIRVIHLNDIEKEYKDLLLAKKNRDLIEYYFTLSPFLPKYFNEKFNIKQISYLDSDFYFFKSPKNAIEDNMNYSVVLIKQYSNPKYGLYNVGWIYFNFNHVETTQIVNIWSQQCLDLCTDFPKNGFYADQKYLDTWPQKLKHIKLQEPEYSCLSPWDSNKLIEKNFENMLAYHFHGLEIKKDYFVSGFSKFNKQNSMNIIDNIYRPYLRNLIFIENKYNLKNSSIRNFSKNNYKKILLEIRMIKSYLKNIYYKDFHDLNVFNKK